MSYLNVDDSLDERPEIEALSDAEHHQMMRDICEWSKTGHARTELVRWLIDERLIRRAPRHWLPEWLLEPARRYRAKIPAEVRTRVYARDGWKCLTCGSHDLSLDHIVPWSLGGSDDETNLQTLCRSCNSRKGARV